jgi:hypothetical protein
VRAAAAEAVADPGAAAAAVGEAEANEVLAVVNPADGAPSAAGAPAAESLVPRDARKVLQKNRVRLKDRVLKDAAKKGARLKASGLKAVTRKDGAKSAALVDRTVIALRGAADPRAAAARKADLARIGVSGLKIVRVIDRGLRELRVRVVPPSEAHSGPNRAPPARFPTNSTTLGRACWKPDRPPRAPRTVTNNRHTNLIAANMAGANRGANIGAHRAVTSPAVKKPANTASTSVVTGRAQKSPARMRSLGQRLTNSTIAREYPRLRPGNPPTMADDRPADAAAGDVRAPGERDRQDRWIGRRQ